MQLISMVMALMMFASAPVCARGAAADSGFALYAADGTAVPAHEVISVLGRHYVVPDDAKRFASELGDVHDAKLDRRGAVTAVQLRRVVNPGESRRVYRAVHEAYGPRSHRPDEEAFWRITSPASPPNTDDPLVTVRDDWLVSEDQILAWHEFKDGLGPALTGSRAWHAFMEMLDDEFSAAGLVDMRYNRWTFDRWTTSQWPDDSDWSLHVGDRRIDVANAGANSGATPSEGVSAPLLHYDFDDPPGTLEGRIVVFRTRFTQAVADRMEALDYEYRSDPETFPERGRAVPRVRAPQSWQIFPQLVQTRQFIEIARAGGAAGALFVFDAGAEQMAGMYTFPVPDHYEVPTLLLDRDAGDAVVSAARAGQEATLRLEAERVESEAYQIVGVLPGRDYGTPADEMLKLTTHTDGPSISQDNGALGLLAVIRYMAEIPREHRPRSLLVFLDSRHFMPGAEEAFAEHDFDVRYPDLLASVHAMIGMEHLGQVEFQEYERRLKLTGRVDTSLLWTTDHERLVDLAIEAVMDNTLPATRVLNVARPGLRGVSQGAWYGMAKHAPELGLPGVAIMGTMGVYWAKSSGVERVDPRLFRDQVATFVQLVGRLMHEDLGALE